MDYDMMNYYHSTGKMPDRYYNQLNGSSLEESYRREKQRRFNISRKKKFNFFEDFVLGLMRACLSKALKEIMDEIIPN